MKAKELVRTAYRVGTGEDIMAPPEHEQHAARIAFDGRSAVLIILALSLLCGLLVGWTMSRPVSVHALPAATARAVDHAEEAGPEEQASDAEPTPTAEPPPATITVYVSGRVASPSLVELPQGSRVALAVEEAGGMTPEADMNALNLARVLVDGEHIVVPAPGEAIPSAAAPELPPTSPPITDLNTAGAAELESLPGVGPAIAQRIIDWRETNGSFSTVEELMEVSGIGPATFDSLRDSVTV